MLSDIYFSSPLLFKHLRLSLSPSVCFQAFPVIFVLGACLINNIAGFSSIFFSLNTRSEKSLSFLRGI